VNPDSKPERAVRRAVFFSKKKSSLATAALTITAGIFAATLTYFQPEQQPAPAAAIYYAQKGDSQPLTWDNNRWGYFTDEYNCSTVTLQRGDVLGSILMAKGLSYPQVNQLVENCKDKFKISSLRVGKPLFFLSKPDEAGPEKMIYEPSPYEYVVFSLKEPFSVNVVKRKVETSVVSASGVLESNFWQALTDNGLSDELADGMIEVLSSSVDFYRQRQGDRFKVVYEQHYVMGQPVGTGKIMAAMYEREGKQSYAFHFKKEGEKTDYYDFEGRPAKKAFLKAPVKFSRISSRFNMNRLHPILGYHKAHLGTDYAAPHGTPIIAVAEGTVIEATQRGGNGKFVRIRHNSTYETQYLHMSGFAKGIKPGTRVAQGQTIGYVGSTGLATGDHVCFRFWKNGRQVDHLRLDLPQPEPIKGELLEEFKTVRDGLIKMIEAVPYKLKGEAASPEDGHMEADKTATMP
jgi:murein DD-endopeptidase MepM/ murein hydrolase activator NlpD